MKHLDVYQQLQLAVVALFFLAFVITGAMYITDPACSDQVATLFSELKTLFLGVLALDGLKQRIAKAMEVRNETDASIVP